MQIETLGDAFAYSGKVWMACALGPYTNGMKRGRECNFRQDLDLPTLVATRGASFPIGLLPQRLKCPRCSSRVVWSFPPVSSEHKTWAVG
ncbi:hypothetical protein ASD64_14710 [Mesorhizobium sp. Root157]|nr:hypothetical protein ASD64_14710 [Mesorhizobium sp. Root157]